MGASGLTKAGSRARSASLTCIPGQLVFPTWDRMEAKPLIAVERPGMPRTVAFRASATTPRLAVSFRRTVRKSPSHPSNSNGKGRERDAFREVGDYIVADTPTMAKASALSQQPVARGVRTG